MRVRAPPGCPTLPPGAQAYGRAVCSGDSAAVFTGTRPQCPVLTEGLMGRAQGMLWWSGEAAGTTDGGQSSLDLGGPLDQFLSLDARVGAK